MGLRPPTMAYPPISGAARGTNDVKWLDALEKEDDLGWSRLRAAFAFSSVNCILFFLGGTAITWYVPGSNGVKIAALLGFAAVYGLAGYLIIRYARRRRAEALAPQPPARPSRTSRFRRR